MNLNIYRPKMQMEADRNASYCRLMVVSDDDRRVLNEAFRGQPIPLSEWKPFKVIRSPSEKVNLTRPLGDRCGIDYKLDPMVLSKRALEVLLPHIAAFGQALPLDFEDLEYNLFNVTHVIDALDEAQSDLYRFPSTGRIGDVLRYAFKPEMVVNEWIFKIPQRIGNFSFVTDRFVQLVESAGLTGFDFELVWSSMS